ncbi:hypothetical protein FJZ28_01225 [Candidatus Peregrinibacteria bacterium]|nr:hypothetical protein [Candidatus Peregrinibacteria bacterium]
MNEIERAMLHMVLLQSESGIVLQTNHLYERHVQGGVVTDIHECADALSKMKTKEREIAIAHLLRSLRHEASEIL